MMFILYNFLIVSLDKMKNSWEGCTNWLTMVGWAGVTLLLFYSCVLSWRDAGCSEPEWDDRGYLIFCLCMGKLTALCKSPTMHVILFYIDIYIK